MVKQMTVNGEQVLPMLHGCALVASSSQPGIWHTIKAGKCDCLGFKAHGSCRHLNAVRALNRESAPLVQPKLDASGLFYVERPIPPARKVTFEEIFGPD